MALYFVRVLIVGSCPVSRSLWSGLAQAEAPVPQAETGISLPRGSSALDLPALDLLFQLQDSVDQPFGSRRTAGHPDVDRDDLVDALHDVVGAIEAAGGCAGAHGHDVF